ncbi:MAG: hypothetical protein ACOVS5_04970, partial [Oligoflexus sp.]
SLGLSLFLSTSYAIASTGVSPPVPVFAMSAATCSVRNSLDRSHGSTLPDRGPGRDKRMSKA